MKTTVMRCLKAPKEEEEEEEEKKRQDIEQARTKFREQLTETDVATRAKAMSEAAAWAGPPPAERKEPVEFQDAVGRKLSFPFEVCCRWEVYSHPSN